MVKTKTRINITIDTEILEAFDTINKGSRSEFIENKMKELIYSCSEKEMLIKEKEGNNTEINILKTRNANIDKEILRIEEEEKKNSLDKIKVEKAMATVRKYNKGSEDLTLDVIKRIASIQKLNYRVLVGKANDENIKIL